MPGFDGTGPRGLGPRAGRGMGRCEGKGGQQEGAAGGFGRGFGCTFTGAEDQLTVNENLEILKRRKENIEKAIAALESELG